MKSNCFFFWLSDGKSIARGLLVNWSRNAAKSSSSSIVWHAGWRFPVEDDHPGRYIAYFLFPFYELWSSKDEWVGGFEFEDLKRIGWVVANAGSKVSADLVGVRNDGFLSYNAGMLEMSDVSISLRSSWLRPINFKKRDEWLKGGILFTWLRGEWSRWCVFLVE